MIRLNQNYTFYQDASQNLMLYDHSKGMAILRIPYIVDLEALTATMQLPQRLESGFTGQFGNLYKLLYDKYPHLFDEISADQAKAIYQAKQLQDGISLHKFLPNAPLENLGLGAIEMSLAIHGLGTLAMDLTGLVLSLGGRRPVLVDYGERVEPWDLIESFYENHHLGALKAEILRDHFGDKVVIAKFEGLADLLPEFTTHLVPVTGQDEAWLSQINGFVLERGHRLLAMTINQEALVIGPLVIPSETACLDCFSAYRGQYLSAAPIHVFAHNHRHLLLGFVSRILLYTHGTHFRFLLEDAQIPLNKQLVIDKATLEGKRVGINKDVDCTACSA